MKYRCALNKTAFSEDEVIYMLLVTFFGLLGGVTSELWKKEVINIISSISWNKQDIINIEHEI